MFPTNSPKPKIFNSQKATNSHVAESKTAMFLRFIFSSKDSVDVTGYSNESTEYTLSTV